MTQQLKPSECSTFATKTTTKTTKRTTRTRKTTKTATIETIETVETVETTTETQQQQQPAPTLPIFSPLPFRGVKISKKPKESNGWYRSLFEQLDKLATKYNRHSVRVFDVFAGSLVVSVNIAAKFPNWHITANDYQRLTSSRIQSLNETEHHRQQLQALGLTTPQGQKTAKLTPQQTQQLTQYLDNLTPEQVKNFDFLTISGWFGFSSGDTFATIDALKKGAKYAKVRKTPMPNIENFTHYLQNVEIVDLDATNFDQLRQEWETSQLAQMKQQNDHRPPLFVYILDPPYFSTNNTGYASDSPASLSATTRTIRQLVQSVPCFFYFNSNSHHDLDQYMKDEEENLHQWTQRLPLAPLPTFSPITYQYQQNDTGKGGKNRDFLAFRF